MLGQRSGDEGLCRSEGFIGTDFDVNGGFAWISF
jgi:hypothetical protein